MLDPLEQRFFDRLGIFVGGWTSEAAAVINEAGDLASTEDVLIALCDQQLVQHEVNSLGEERWRLLETIRDYALAPRNQHDRSSSTAPCGLLPEYG